MSGRQPARGPRPTARRTGATLAVSAGLLLVGGLLLAPRSAVGLPPTSVLNVLFESRWMVGATRVTGAITLWFLLASMVARASAGQWVRRAGSVDVGDEVEAVSADQELLQQRLISAHDTIERLRAQLAEAVALLESVSDDGGTRDADRRHETGADGGNRADR